MCNHNNMNKLSDKIPTIDAEGNILIENIQEDNRLLKYFLNYVIFFGALGFFIVGSSSYFRFNLIPFLDASQIIFFPQGITMLIYGLRQKSFLKNLDFAKKIF